MRLSVKLVGLFIHLSQTRLRVVVVVGQILRSQTQCLLAINGVLSTVSHDQFKHSLFLDAVLTLTDLWHSRCWKKIKPHFYSSEEQVSC